ncbi:MAG TPA: FAD-dependent oxidoreductase [Bacteroidales bacterium]|nr:FAD-dependent oxidoreductase [Bacteroidales bacterium]HSA44677.1 FAD-dependent oxidoreductase [Bacteroidales bacterium]
MNQVNVILNGQILNGNQGETILELAHRHGIHIPTLCHDPRLEPFTSCYVCVVEVEGMRGLQPSCSTKIAEGMKIDTCNEKVNKARKTALDLLLSNHYADCAAPCKLTCPAGVDVQGYISFIEKGMYHEAVELIKETNPLPAICGRVCVRPCEVACRRNLLDEGYGVGIDYLKRFAADRDLESPAKWKPTLKKGIGKKVAVIGAGPAGLSAAFFLRKEGHAVDIFEAAPAAGGWLRYGIPPYRLPNELLQQEVDNITELGARIFYNSRLGDNLSFKDLRTDYHAFILAIGSQKGTSIGCEGDDAVNVFSGVDFLKEMEMTGKPFDFTGKKVAIVGGGNTAMDCCRTALRCGAAKSVIIYRRTENEMPANPIEIHESKLEGVEYMVLTNPARVNKDEEGRVKSITCIRMELGEPDASGRRRPVPVEGSEFDIEVDYILAAIGQKTHIDFLEDINQHVKEGQLKANRWGDIDADPKTLQTGVPGIFAAGDGVSGPATLIQAIAQARIAARSCNQFLNGESLQPEPFEFISKKDNFKTQHKQDYLGLYPNQTREEMPTLDPAERKNFREVELGYDSPEVAFHETQRCLECGCTEYYDCDLKRYATEYHAEQNRLGGAFSEYQVDFRHPYIEIDNNKCILCSRCIRICRDVAGASALGLINRGYETYVAPAMGKALAETSCESCGLCISACPTAAISENFDFKPGPVKLDKAETVCNYCSIGCRINLNHKNGFVMKVSGEPGPVNTTANLCRFPKFGYAYLNDPRRITTPLLKKGDGFEEISFSDAFAIIADRIRSVKPDENAFFAGARLTNEELYLVQKLARAGAGTNQTGSFHYLQGGEYAMLTEWNTPFEQLPQTSKIFLLGAELNRDHAVAGFMVNEARLGHHVPVCLVTTMPHSPMEYKADALLRVRSYYHLLRAVNYHLLSQKLYNQLYINDHCLNWEAYQDHLAGEDFNALCSAAGLDSTAVIAFAEDFNLQMNAVLVCSEKELDAAALSECFNLAMLTGKLGKTASGLIVLREKNNAQGIFDMGVQPHSGCGGQSMGDEAFLSKLREKWGMKHVPAPAKGDMWQLLHSKSLKNIFIFGEDPLGCAVRPEEIKALLQGTAFLLVQDAFMTDTARLADLIMPASFPAETGGSFTNTQKVYQEFQEGLPQKTAVDAVGQLLAILAALGCNGLANRTDAMMEAFSLLPENNHPTRRFVIPDLPSGEKMFRYGCDAIQKRFEEEFKAKLGREF